VLVINKVDRPDARIAEVVDEAYELFLDLDADEHQIEFPIVYCQAKAGKASLTRPEDGTSPDADDLTALFQTILTSVPAPRYDPEAPLQALVTNLDASPYLGRLALCRIVNGDLARGQSVMWCKTDGTMERVKISELLMTEALDRLPAEKAGPGDIVAIAGIPEITIGETLADLDDPRPLPVPTIDEPSISMTLGVNTSPLAGQSGKKLTARLVKARLDTELVGNVSIRVLETERPDTWEVQGRGELQLAILVEIMRREGFELTVGKPQVVTRVIDGNDRGDQQAHQERDLGADRARQQPARHVEEHGRTLLPVVLAQLLFEARPRLRARSPASSTTLRIRTIPGVTSTHSSSRQNSRACSKESALCGMSGTSTSPEDWRMLVSFFSFVGFTSMSSAREFSPTIMPSYTSVPGPTNMVPRSCRFASAYPVVGPVRSAISEPVGRVRNSPCQGE
jgi:hypothetical protein